MNEFYLTLISNSTLQFYPTNTTSSFIVHLPQKVILNEGAVVGLAEIQFPYNFFNVNEKNNTYSIVHGDFTYDGAITTGFYKSRNELVKEVLKHTNNHFGDWIHIDNVTNRTKITKTAEYEARHAKSATNIPYRHMCFHGRLATQLGFAPDENVFMYESSSGDG